MSQNKSFQILEYKHIYYGKSKNSDGYLKITKKAFKSIENFILSNNQDDLYYLKPSTKKGLGKTLQARNYVGLIETNDGTTIEILPKIADNEDVKTSREVLCKMLKTLRDVPFRNFGFAHLKSTNMPLMEIFISMFLDELSILVKKGIKSDYIPKEENLKFLKGKLNIGKHIKQNYIHKERFFVEFDEYSKDRVENRLIKTTLFLLLKKSKSNKNQLQIRKFLTIFDEVSVSSSPKADFTKIKINREMKHYESTILWCKIFLANNSFSNYKGNDIAFALLFNMNELFESYVGAYCKKHFKDVELKPSGVYLVEKPDKKFQLKPDIKIDEKCILDTKWKVIKEEKDISQADMYQLYAYGKKFGIENLYLIYPKMNDEQERFKYKFDEKLRLRVCYFDVE